MKPEELERLQQHHPLAGDSDEQYTPTRYFERWNREFQFTLDPAATPESAKCSRYYTVITNGLAQSWRGERVFLNPPYTQIGRWLQKVKDEMASGCQCVLALLPAWTDRKWWHKYVEPLRVRREIELRFLEGRIKFGCPGDLEGELDEVFGVERSVGTFPSVIIIWRAKGLVIPDPRQIDWVKAQDGAHGALGGQPGGEAGPRAWGGHLQGSAEALRALPAPPPRAGGGEAGQELVEGTAPGGVEDPRGLASGGVGAVDRAERGQGGEGTTAGGAGDVQDS